MLLDVTLCKTPINTTDTLYFANETNQKAYFNGITEKTTYENASFNGARSFRINVNYLEAINTKYNYMYYEHDNRTWYCFIDTYEYINDNTTAVNVTLDFIQTFMFDITWKSSRVASLTWKESHISSLQPYKGNSNVIPYSNKFPVFNHKYELVKRYINYCTVGGKSCRQGYLAITIDDKNLRGADSDNLIYHIFAKFEKYDGSNYSYDVRKIVSPKDAPAESGTVDAVNWWTVRSGQELDVMCFMFPIYYNGSEWRCYATDINFSYTELNPEKYGIWDDEASSTLDGNDIQHIIDTFVKNFSAYIIDISIIPSMISQGESGVLEYNGLSTPYLKLNHVPHETGLTPILIGQVTDGMINKHIIAKGFLSSAVYYGDDFSVISNVNMSPTYRDFIEIENSPLNRNPYYSYIIGNGIDNTELEISDIGEDEIEINIIQDIFMPYNTIVKIPSMWDEVFTITFSLTQSAPYSVSEWASYYANAKISVNDGLKTKQAYDKEIAKKTLTTATMSGGIESIVGAIGVSIGAMMSKGGSQAVLGGGAQMVSGISSIIDARTQYQNTLTNLEKERALLGIEWGDIKSAPNNFFSLGNDTSILSATDNAYINIYIKSPVNIEQIKKYHKMYGYQTEEVVSAEELKQYHTVFDYIRFEDANFITNLPHNTHQIIKKIFESGVRFWYDIDTFLNFDIDNPEYQGA